MKLSFLCMLILSGLIMISGCHRKNQKIEETPTTGNIKMDVDESYNLLIEAEDQVFEALYPYAKINIKYTNEVDAISDFLKDSVQNIIISTQLSPEQVAFLRSKNYIVKTTEIAQDALAFIINPGNTDSNLRYDQIVDLFLGKIKNWNQINPASRLGQINIIFDNEKSGNVRYMKNKFNLEKNLPSNFFAVKSNDEVINYVQKNPNAIGVISVNWISNKFDTLTHEFLTKIKVVSVGDSGNNDNFSKPYAGYIADGTYPFIRKVYFISRETFPGLGTGFASFISSPQGQKIVLKDGLVPSTMPVRLIERKNKLTF